MMYSQIFALSTQGIVYYLSVLGSVWSMRVFLWIKRFLSKWGHSQDEVRYRMVGRFSFRDLCGGFFYGRMATWVNGNVVEDSAWVWNLRINLFKLAITISKSGDRVEPAKLEGNILTRQFSNPAIVNVWMVVSLDLRVFGYGLINAS